MLTALMPPVLVMLLAAAPAAPAPVLPAAEAWAGVQQGGGSTVPDSQVDINSASAAELQKVPGIGPALAQRIIQFREEHGPYERIDDLLNVRGIGVRSLERLRPYLTVKAPKDEARSRR